MISAGKFDGYLKSEGGDRTQKERDLREILDVYPWFTTARVMLYRETGDKDPLLKLYLQSYPFVMRRSAEISPEELAAEMDEDGMEAVGNAYGWMERAEDVHNARGGQTEIGVMVPAPDTEVAPEQGRSIAGPVGAGEYAGMAGGDINISGNDPAEKSTETVLAGSDKASLTESIIDSFLLSGEHRIIPDDSATDEDIAEKSGDLDLSDDMVSEELAAIYLAQGLKSEAKEIYRKLILLYPEKSIYFAEIIDGIADNED